MRLRDRIGRSAAQYIDVERCATTPERFLQAVTSTSPFRCHGSGTCDARAKRLTRCWPISTVLAPPAASRAPSSSMKCSSSERSRAFPACATSPGSAQRAREQPQPVRAHDSLRCARSPTAPRCHLPLRGDAPPPMMPREITELLSPIFGGYERWRPTTGTISVGRCRR